MERSAVPVSRGPPHHFLPDHHTTLRVSLEHFSCPSWTGGLVWPGSAKRLRRTAPLYVVSVWKH